MGVEALMIGAMVMSAGGAIYTAEKNADIADDNAALMRQQAAAEQDAAVAQAEKIRRAARAQVSEANAAMAASGVSLGEGTPVRINEQILRDSEEDAYNTILTGTRRGRTTEAEAGIMRQQGKSAYTAGMINAGSTVLSGGADYRKWQASQKKPATTTSVP